MQKITSCADLITKNKLQVKVLGEKKGYFLKANIQGLANVFMATISRLKAFYPLLK